MVKKINKRFQKKIKKEMDWLNGYFFKGLYICCLQETHFRPEDTERGNGERYLVQREIKRKLE